MVFICKSDVLLPSSLLSAHSLTILNLYPLRYGKWPWPQPLAGPLGWVQVSQHQGHWLLPRCLRRQVSKGKEKSNILSLSWNHPHAPCFTRPAWLLAAGVGVGVGSWSAVMPSPNLTAEVTDSRDGANVGQQDCKRSRIFSAISGFFTAFCLHNPAFKVC